MNIQDSLGGVILKKNYVGFLNGWGVKRLTQNKRTKGKFNNTDVRFHFEYPQIKEIRGITFVKFDKYLNLVEPLYFDFIPSFIKENRNCDFISNDTALKIAKDSLKQKGLYDIKPYLSYDSHRMRYTYEFDNTLTEMKDVYGNNTGNMEVLIIDAITKEMLYHNINWYGPIY